MITMKKKFDNETKTRINILGSNKCGKSNLIASLVKKGIFEDTGFIEKDKNINFSTEVLCSATRSNEVRVYLSIKDLNKVENELKMNILKCIDEAFVKVIYKVENESALNYSECINLFLNSFREKLFNSYKNSLNTFFENDKLDEIFADVDLNYILNELENINEEDLLEEKDEFIWTTYFKDFNQKLQLKYDEWINRIYDIYGYDEYGYDYLNEREGSEEFHNKYLKNLFELLYGQKSSCGLIIERVYIEAPSRKNEYSRVIFIDSYSRIMENFIEKRVEEDYKELFILIAESEDDIKDILNLKDNISKFTLDKRIFCILNNLMKDGDEIEKIQSKIAKVLGINANRIINTENFHDSNLNTIKTNSSNDDFINLLKLMERKSEEFSNMIKVKNPSRGRVLKIELNQERMSVQALMSMLYERYNGYLVELWNKVLEEEKNDYKTKKYYYNVVRNIIRNRKYGYNGFKYKNSDYLNFKGKIDFTLNTGDYNGSKKILDMLINYGYDIIGFNINQNKILVTVNGEISKEDKENLINSIKGRLEESIVKYFESTFLSKITKNKFNKNSLINCLESEKNITIEDFYSVFREIFNKMSEDIERYEIYRY